MTPFVQKALLVCAGKGTRLYPLTKTLPKAMVPINGTPMIDLLIDQIKETGIRDIGLIVSPFSRPHFDAHLGDGATKGVKITYILQEEPKGIAHAIYQAKDYVGNEPFFVSLGDNVTSSSLQSLLHTYHTSPVFTVIGVVKVTDPSRYGIVQVNAAHEITQIVEKPTIDLGNLAASGFYVFHPDIFSCIERLTPSKRGEFEITDAIGLFVDQEKKCLAVPIQGWWKDVGTPKDVEEISRLQETC